MASWKKLSNLFGLGPHDETDSYSIKHQSAWLERRKRLLHRRCGHLTDSCKIGADGVVKSTGDNLQAQQKSRQKRQLRRQQSIPPPRSSSAQLRSPSPIGFRVDLSSTDNVAVPDDFLRSQYPGIGEDQLDEKTHDDTDFEARESIVKLVNDVLARHQPKRAFGMGLVGNLLSRKFRKDLTYSQISAIYSFDDNRPYFTYWVTTVQILIMLISLFTYGLGPFGFTGTIVKDTVIMPSLAPTTVSYMEKDNIWLGPRAADLIHLGAKFTPCMRRDALTYDQITIDRLEERSTGCCIKKDQSGCMQTQQNQCTQNAIWRSWNESTSPSLIPKYENRPRTSGPVCGQDPEYCLAPASKYPHEWPDDITRWPICSDLIETAKPLHHMSCELTGRPCCVGIYGQCLITYSDHCQFLRGTFHPEATLCSQVSCMEDVCGMVPFYARDYPDQFYRLFTAIFLHAGLIHLSFTIVLQYYIMRDIERLLGSTRMAIIYILPGIAGYLASATFVPYHTQVGPSGSQFALLACLMAETINSWKLLDDPGTSLMKLILIAVGLFVVGLLPWIDNYAHIFGFITGLLLSLALTPYLTPFNDAYSRRMKVIQTWVCMVLVILMFIILPIPLYVFPLYQCSWCKYLDCLPITATFCENQDIKLPDRAYFD